MGVNGGRSVTAVTYLLLQEPPVGPVLGQVRDRRYLYFFLRNAWSGPLFAGEAR